MHRLIRETNLLRRKMDVNTDDYYNFEDDAIEDLLSNDRTNAAYVATILSLFGLLISSATAFIAILSFKEDQLMKRYRDHGELVHAEVISTNFTRGNISSHDDEYSVCLDYLRKLTQYYDVRIRKSLKVKASSIIDPMSGEVKKVILYVIPEHQKSGYPKDMVDSKCSLSYWISTCLLLIMTEAIALSFFIFPVTRFRQRREEGENNNSSLVLPIFGTFFCLSVIIWPLLYYFARSSLEKALQDEYFENGDILPADNDASTITTFDNNTHLKRDHSPTEVQHLALLPIIKT